MPLIIHSGSIMLFSLLSLNNFEFSKNKFFKFCICNKFQLFFMRVTTITGVGISCCCKTYNGIFQREKKGYLLFLIIFPPYPSLPPSLCKQHTSSEFLRASAAGPACHRMTIQPHNHNPHLWSFFCNF